MKTNTNKQLRAAKFSVITIALISILTANLYGAVISSNGTGGGNWNSGASWAGGFFPNATDDAQILSGDVITLTASANITNITVDVGGTLSCSTVGAVKNLAVTGNVTMNGSYISNSKGLITFTGTANQNLTTAAGVTLYDVTVTVPGFALVVNSNVTIENTLTMSNGNINLTSYTLTLGTSTAVLGSLTYSNGVIYGGTFARWFDTSTIEVGNTSGLLPMGTSAGDDRFVYVGLTAPAAGGTISGTHTDLAPNVTTVGFDDPTDATGPLQVITQTNWAMTSGNGLAGGTYDLRFYGENIGQVGNINDLRLTRSDDVLGTYAANGGTTGNPQVNRTSLGLADLTNTFYVGSVDASSSNLPVVISSFTAQLSGGNITLKWTTQSETNNASFDVERSNDGKNFSAIGNVKGAGTTQTAQNYQYTDDQKKAAGTYYYRLKMTDSNGQSTYSSTVEVNFADGLSEFTVSETYPNPVASGTAKVNVSLPTEGTVTCTIYSVTGQKVKEFSVQKPAGESSMDIDTATLSPGIYLYSISYNLKSISGKFVRLSNDGKEKEENEEDKDKDKDNPSPVTDPKW